MKKKSSFLNSKFLWMALSLMASLILWVYVSGQETDEYTRTFRGVPVDFVGEDILREKGMAITDLSTGTVTIEITGPRRIVGGLDNDDLLAQVNVSNITQSATASMTYSVKYPDGTETGGIVTKRKVPETISFNVSKLTSKTIPVKGSFDGSTASGYTAEPAFFEPETITISGAEVYLKNVSYAWVSFGAENIQTTYSMDVGYTLMSEEKEPVSSDGISCDVELIKATLPILEMKDVPLNIDLIYGAGADEHNTSVTIEPEFVTLAGDSAILNGLNKITLATIDLTKCESAFTEVYPIVFDDTLMNISGSLEAEVSIKIDGLSTREFSIADSNMSAINVTDGFSVEILNKSMSVILRGTEENLDSIQPEHLRAVADLADFDFTAGAHQVPAKIYVDDAEGNSVGCISDAKLQIQIERG